jgi:hypothetical protein
MTKTWFCTSCRGNIHRYRWNDNIKMGLKYVMKVWFLFSYWLTLGSVEGFCELFTNLGVSYSAYFPDQLSKFPFKVRRPLRPDDGGSEHLRNSGQFLPDYTAQHPRRQPSCVAQCPARVPRGLPWDPTPVSWRTLLRVSNLFGAVADRWPSLPWVAARETEVRLFK